MKVSHALLFFFTFLIAGCTEHAVYPTSPSLDLSVISPLKTGDEWIYDVATYDSTGTIVQDVADTVRVGLSIEIHGQHCFLVSHNNNPKSTFYFTNGKDGYYSFEEGMDSFLLDFKYPVQAGYSKLVQWDSMEFSTPITVTGQILNVPSTNEIISIGSEQLSCYHYQSILFTVQNNDTVYKKATFEAYLAPGIGEVRVIERFDESFDPKTGATIKNGSEIITLKSYSLK